MDTFPLTLRRRHLSRHRLEGCALGTALLNSPALILSGIEPAT